MVLGLFLHENFDKLVYRLLIGDPMNVDSRKIHALYHFLLQPLTRHKLRHSLCLDINGFLCLWIHTLACFSVFDHKAAKSHQPNISPGCQFIRNSLDESVNEAWGWKDSRPKSANPKRSRHTLPVEGSWAQYQSLCERQFCQAR